jgi:hypothetical protein
MATQTTPTQTTLSQTGVSVSTAITAGLRGIAINHVEGLAA